MQSVFDLPEDDPDAFELFLGWLYGNNKEVEPSAPPLYERGVWQLDLWTLYPAEAYVIGDKFMARDFSKYAFCKIIQHAQLLHVYDMETIYQEVKADDPLRLFAKQWVRWRCSQRPDLWASSQSMGLQRDRHLRQGRSGTRQVPVLDPRRIQIDHWYSICGLVGHDCEHLPATCGATTFENDKKAEEKTIFRRLWAKSASFNRPTRAWVLLRAFLVAYGTRLIMLAIVVLGVWVVANVLLYSMRF